MVSQINVLGGGGGYYGFVMNLYLCLLFLIGALGAPQKNMTTCIFKGKKPLHDSYGVIK